MQRSEAYIGVLIDDLINKGTEEPYRMFTSRAEYRTLLRQDNADIRLTPKGLELGLASEERRRNLEEKTAATTKIVTMLQKEKVAPEQVNPRLEQFGLSPIREKTSLEQLLKRPQIGIEELAKLDENFASFISEFSDESREHAEIEVKYASYIEKEKLMVGKMKRMEDHVIPEAFNYHQIPALSIEAKQKLSKLKPSTIGQASRISGVSPADISVLIIHLGR